MSNPKIGDLISVKRNMFRRGGQYGQVLQITPDGILLDFYTCGICGAKHCTCYTSIEMWQPDELELAEESQP